MEPSRRGFVLVILLVVLAAVPATTAASGADGSDAVHRSVPDDHGSVSVAGSVAPPSNGTTEHENPEEVDEDGDLGAVAAWLEGRLGGRLEGSLVELERGNHERARRLLGDEYDDLLGRYVDVAGDAGRPDGSGESYEETRENQEEFADAVQEYRETREEYQRASEEGNDERARELARELQRLERRVNRTASDLRESYRDLDGRRGIDPEAAAARVRSIQADVTERQERIRESEFVATRVTVTAESGEGSFLDPLAFSGRLTTEDGTPVADEPVRFRIRGRTVETTTDGDGRFSFPFRPTTLPVGETSVTVEYVPANASLFLGSTDPVAVDVSQVTPSVTLDERPGSVAFGDPVTVTGRVAAEDVGAGGVPVVVRLGDVRLGQTRTDADGTFTLRTRLPATVPAGSRKLTAEVAQEDRAIASASATASVDVETTDTDLQIAGERSAPGEVLLSGTLTTADGRPVADQEVRLLVAGEQVATVRTDGDGTFETTVEIPGGNGSDGGSVTVEAVYDPQGANLEPSEASVELTLPDGQPGGPGHPDAGGGGLQVGGGVTIPWPWVGVAAGVLLLGSGVAVLGRRRSGGEPSPADVEPESPAKGAEPEEENPTDDGESSPEPVSLEDARERLADGATDEAVRMAYGAVRRVAADVGAGEEWTHWEFYLAYEAAATDEQRLDDLRRLTEAYERAAYAPARIDRADASEAVDVAERFVDKLQSG